jgi:hypothetical protein
MLQQWRMEQADRRPIIGVDNVKMTQGPDEKKMVLYWDEENVGVHPAREIKGQSIFVSQKLDWSVRGERKFSFELFPKSKSYPSITCKGTEKGVRPLYFVLKLTYTDTISDKVHEQWFLFRWDGRWLPEDLVLRGQKVHYSILTQASDEDADSVKGYLREHEPDLLPAANR